MFSQDWWMKSSYKILSIKTDYPVLLANGYIWKMTLNKLIPEGTWTIYKKFRNIKISWFLWLFRLFLWNFISCECSQIIRNKSFLDYWMFYHQETNISWGNIGDLKATPYFEFVRTNAIRMAHIFYQQPHLFWVKRKIWNCCFKFSIFL